jgi:type I restriction enzyme M protein
MVARAPDVSHVGKDQQLMPLRADLLSSFQAAVRPVGLLDRFQVAGVIASWWGDTQNDLKTIAARGFIGLVESWEASIVNALEDKAWKGNGLDHKLVKRLVPDYLADLEELEANKADLEATVKAATGGSAEDEEDGKESAEELSEQELKAAKKNVAAINTKLKKLQKQFVIELQKARSELDVTSARELVLGILAAELRAILESYVASQRGLVVSAFEMWWDKYRVTLNTSTKERDEAAHRLEGFLVGLGYER